MKSGVARRVQLFEFGGLGACPQQAKCIGVSTDAQLAETVKDNLKKDENVNNAVL